MTEIDIEEAETPKKKRNRAVLFLIAVIVFLILLTQIGFYSVQPIGALPEGGTTIVWRASGEPFFNSPDGTCLQLVGEVSLLCRAVAMSEAPIDRIIIRLPYQHWAYLLSTNGQEFDR